MTAATSVGEPLELAELRSAWLAPAAEEDFALPTVTDFHAVIQVAWGPTGIQNWVAAPTALPTPTALLYRLDEAGRPVRVGPDGVEYQWAPAEVLRRHPAVRTRTTLADGGTAVEEYVFAEPGRYQVVFAGLCRSWSFPDYWNLPPEDVPQFNLAVRDGGLDMTDTKTFGCARFEFDGPVGSLATFRSMDDFHRQRPATGAGRVAAVTIEAQTGTTLRWFARQGVSDVVLAEEPRTEAGESWERVWRDAFTPGNDTFSGHLPALRFGDPDLDRLYYLAVHSLLQCRRFAPTVEHRATFATGGQAIWSVERTPLEVAYVWGGPEGAPTTSFLWELQLTAPLLARLDPTVLRATLEQFLVADMGSHWGIDTLTGAGVGMWYGVNDGAMINVAFDYLRLTGDRAWLDAVVGGRPVRERLLGYVDRIIERVPPGGNRTDSGAAPNILECVSSYEHEIAAFNAMGSWACRFAAALLAPDRADYYTGWAETLRRGVLELAHPDGYFCCIAEGERREVRTCLDLIYVGRFVPDALDEDMRQRMTAFFHRELETVDWMYALSPADADALTDKLPSFQTYRADHQATGAYDGWPGMSASVLLHFRDPEALGWLARVARVTREGPFGQAHFISATGERDRPATKASFFNGNLYLESCGCSAATTLLEQVAGLGSWFDDQRLLRHPEPPR